MKSNPDPDFTNHVDLLFPYKSGFLEVDDDFLKQINGVFTSPLQSRIRN